MSGILGKNLQTLNERILLFGLQYLTHIVQFLQWFNSRAIQQWQNPQTSET
jgi:hypothetical protein